MKVNKTMVSVAAAVVLPIAVATNVFAYTTEQFSAEANKASYWGTSCVKYESITTSTYTAPAGATKVIVKGGTLNAVYTVAPFNNLTAATNPNTGKPYGISHVIVCTGTTMTPVTPVTPTTPDPDTNTPDKPHNVDGKDDKNQSGCNPSDTNSANPKHWDDDVDCETDYTTAGGGSGTISDAAAAWTASSVKGASVTTPGTIAAAGVSLSGIVLPLIAGGAAYATMFLRNRS